MALAVRACNAPLDQLAHAPKRPQISGKAFGHRPAGKCPHQLAALRGVHTRRSTPQATLERCQTARLELRLPLGHRRARYADASRHFGRRDTLPQQPARPQAYEAHLRSNGRNKSGGS